MNEIWMNVTWMKFEYLTSFWIEFSIYKRDQIRLLGFTCLVNIPLFSWPKKGKEEKRTHRPNSEPVSYITAKRCENKEAEKEEEEIKETERDFLLFDSQSKVNWKF